MYKDVLAGTHAFLTDVIDEPIICKMKGVKLSDLFVSPPVVHRRSGMTFPKNKTRLVQRVFDQVTWQQAFGFIDFFAKMYHEGEDTARIFLS